jgi:tetratricopeptide (TPR) repeat protein
LRWLPGRPEPERFADRAQALAWLDAERAALVAAVFWGREERFARAAVRLAACLSAHLAWRRYFDDWSTVARVAQEAAHRAGDRRGEATAWSDLGLALREAGRVDEAIEAATRARDLHQTTGDRHNEATPWSNVGLALHEAGRVDEAIEAATRARDLHQITGDLHGEATAWSNVGLSLGGAGRVEEAIEAYGRALTIYEDFEDWYGAARTFENLALTHQRARRPAEARTAYLRAAEAFARANAPTEEAQARAQAQRAG